MKNILIIIGIMMITNHSVAAASVEIWEGDGVLFNSERKVISNYKLTVQNIELSDKVTQSNVTVKLPDGSVRKYQCTNTYGEKGWSTQCDDGEGGGYCFGQGLCQSYISHSNGNSFATTIVKDGPKNMRLLRTQLEEGRATGFFREKLHKK
ncbi:MAG: hypothetical protein HOO06_13605 [Bdellovibrionaceae bacterium]|jgi:hypothetical protein|nr:hypothetical protein [Pseudobdellovibrionaceae bacterium]